MKHLFITFSVLPLRIDSRSADLGSFAPGAECPFESVGGMDKGGGGGGGAHTANEAGGGGGGAGAPEKHTSDIKNGNTVPCLTRVK
jgi:hypothetical protein